MTCEFQSLVYSDDGYVVMCAQCRYYQVAYKCICLTVTEPDFQAFCRIVKSKYEEAHPSFAENSKCVVIETPAEGISFLLTKVEAKRFIALLEEADNEARALSFIDLFNP